MLFTLWHISSVSGMKDNRHSYYLNFQVLGSQCVAITLWGASSVSTGILEKPDFVSTGSKLLTKYKASKRILTNIYMRISVAFRQVTFCCHSSAKFHVWQDLFCLLHFHKMFQRLIQDLDNFSSQETENSHLKKTELKWKYFSTK